MKNILIQEMTIASALVFVRREISKQELSFQTILFVASPYGEWGVPVGDYGKCWRPVGVPFGCTSHTSMDTGSGQITAGPGYPIMIGDGHRSTMADGN